MIRCVACDRTAPDGAPGWVRIQLSVSKVETGAVKAQVDEFLCPEDAAQADRLIKGEEDHNGTQGNGVD